jgi:hypothetical protein
MPDAVKDISALAAFLELLATRTGTKQQHGNQ